MIQLRDICLSFGKQKVFNNISCTFNDDQRIGLVGNNGSGKSTLLKAIAGMQRLDEGSIARLSEKTIAYMPQEVVLVSEKNVVDETFTAFARITALQVELTKLEQTLDDGLADEHIITRYAELSEQLASFNPDSALAETKRVLAGLGFSEQQMQGSVNELSVGWKMRIVLAKLLLQKADFYLFDEPTNHLDIFAKEWFLEFLKKSSFGFLLVCHERYFLEELCNYIFELERGNGTLWRGNYSSYLTQKESQQALQQAAYDQQQKEIARKQATIDRFKASASRAKAMQSMAKALDRIELIDAPASAPKKINLQFNNVPSSGRIVLTAKDLSYTFEKKLVFKNVSFEIERGHKVAVVAANGVGKTTLFNVLAGIYKQQSGSITFGHNVATTIFEQDQHKALNPSKTIIEEVTDACGKKSDAVIRGSLGAFLFAGDDVYKKISVLSGGEKNRVAMVKVLLQDANFLLLDEPTNHLDIISREILLNALQEYPGTILFVSHDRDFVNDLATDVIELTPNGAYFYQGNYDSYIYQKKQAATSTQPSKPEVIKSNESKSSVSKELFELKKNIKRLEDKIDTLHDTIAKLQEELGNYSFGTSEFSNLTNRLLALKQQHDECSTQWELLQKQYDALHINT